MIQSREMPSEQRLIESILGDAETQAGSLLTEAQNAAQAVLEQSKGEAGAIAGQILAKARRDADALVLRTCAKARVEARRAVLQAREEAIAGVLDRVEKALQEIRGDTPRYRGAMISLLAEAILAIGEERVVLVVGAADTPLVNGRLLEDVKNRVYERSGLAVTVDLRFEDTDLGGGGLAQDSEGRARLDNTFPRRLKEASKKLKPLIVAEIEKHRG